MVSFRIGSISSSIFFFVCADTVGIISINNNFPIRFMFVLFAISIDAQLHGNVLPFGLNDLINTKIDK